MGPELRQAGMTIAVNGKPESANPVVLLKRTDGGWCLYTPDVWEIGHLGYVACGDGAIASNLGCFAPLAAPEREPYVAAIKATYSGTCATCGHVDTRPGEAHACAPPAPVHPCARGVHGWRDCGCGNCRDRRERADRMAPIIAAERRLDAQKNNPADPSLRPYQARRDAILREFWAAGWFGGGK